MTFLARLFRPVLSFERLSCHEQLRKDFGEFPPNPLQCENLTGEFSVVRPRGIGIIYNDLVVQFRALDADIDSLSTDIVAKFGADRLKELQGTFARLGPHVAWCVKRVLFCWLFIVRTAKTIKYGMPKPNAQGLFIPLFKDELQIIVKMRRGSNESDAHIVSHEHIHLLQHRNPESHSRAVSEPHKLLSKDGLADSFILYILEKMEVEARLHETVLSFYRAHHYLPTTVRGFLGLLASSETLGWQIANILESGSVEFHRDLGNYYERDVRPVEHLGWILSDIKTPELQRRYITEVLSVMYGNLLKYYGDNEASERFLEGVERPNFYDELYAAQAH